MEQTGYRNQIPRAHEQIKMANPSATYQTRMTTIYLEKSYRDSKVSKEFRFLQQISDQNKNIQKNSSKKS